MRCFSALAGRVVLWPMIFLPLSGAVLGQTASSEPTVLKKSDAGRTSTKDKIKRWVEIDQLSAATRYRFIESDNKTKLANQFQYQFTAKFHVKFDPAGKYSVAANIATGGAITSGWNSTGWGTGNTQRFLNLRQLYFAARPVKAVEVQAGGLYVNYGESTEVTTYDNDFYITGERLKLRLPKHLYFDEISVTYARLGDVIVPNVIKRFKNFEKQNYHQFLVRKQINRSVGFSADYTFESGSDTFHQAIKWKLPGKQIIDTFLFESYERIDPDHSYGFNVFGEKRLSALFTVSGGFAKTDIRLFNGDRYPPGKRLYFNATAKISPEFSLTSQFTQGVGFISPIIPRTRVDVILHYNILETLRRTRLF
jgi:hypothetical protein